MILFLVTSFIVSALFVFAVPVVALRRAFRNLKKEGFGSLLTESEQILDSRDDFKNFVFFIGTIVLAVVSSASTAVLTFVNLLSTLF